MMPSRFRRMLLLAMLCLVLFAGRSGARAYLWLVLDLPSSPTSVGSTFKTDLRVSSWNGAAGALDLTVCFDPAVLEVAGFSTPADSDFYANCFAEWQTSGAGRMRVTCFQVSTWEAQDPPAVLGTIEWHVVGPEGADGALRLEPGTAVEAGWAPLELLAYGPQITIGAQRVYLPIVWRNP